MKSINRRLSTKRFNGEDMATFARYLLGCNRTSSIRHLTEWLDGPLKNRGVTHWNDGDKIRK